MDKILDLLQGLKYTIHAYLLQIGEEFKGLCHVEPDEWEHNSWEESSGFNKSCKGTIGLEL